MNALRNQTAILTSTAALILGSAVMANAGGFAAPVVEPVVAPIIEAPVMNWQGGYIGATLGYGFGGDDVVGITDITATPNVYRGDIGDLGGDGVNAGIRAGYTLQRDRWVFGPELGFEMTNIKGETNGTIGVVPMEAETRIKNVLALRLKAGYLVQPDMLVYGIAGWARADVDYEVAGNNLDFKKDGYVVGLGVEKRLSDRMSVTGEYEYANFGKETLSTDMFSTEATPVYNNVKVGLNFRF
ncbi:outer membrane beta-barrel protein [Paracoccus sp. (in: a-proteobacteria)]|uniref:outer membrane protein n=1 Tax=Paracoccus sp. TaxID=267 RepID=UPI0032206BF4